MDEDRKSYKIKLISFFFSKTELNVVKFLMVGGLNTIFGYSVFALTYLWLTDFRICITSAYFLGFIFNVMSAKLFLLPHSKNKILYLIGVYSVFALANYFLLLALEKYHNVYVLQLFIQLVLVVILYIILKILEKLSHD